MTKRDVITMRALRIILMHERQMNDDYRHDMRVYAQNGVDVDNAQALTDGKLGMLPSTISSTDGVEAGKTYNTL